MKSPFSHFLSIISLCLVLALGFFTVKLLLNSPFPEPEDKTITSTTSGSVYPWSLEGYTKEATAIVTGTVESLVNNPEANRLEATLKVAQVIKGDSTMTSIKIQMLEGEKKDNVWVEDSVLLQPGEKLLVFVGVDEKNNYVVAGGPNGKFFISDDGFTVSNENVNLTATPLIDFIAQIKAILGQ